MMMMSFRLNLKNVALILVAVLTIAVLLAGLRWAIGELWLTDAVSARVTKQAAGATEEERVHFMTAYGWEVEKPAAEMAEVLIPSEFDEVYRAYNALQKKQGYDLQKYSGKRCMRYTYIVKNYPTGEKNVRINLLICSGKIIGGDVMSVRLDGFMHGFTVPKS